MALSALATRSRLLTLITFVLLALMLVNDADARTRSRTVGGTSTDLHHHGITLKCTWEDFQGVWDSDTGDSTASPPTPISVSHSVGDPGDTLNHNYAICGGWDIDTAPSGSLTNSDGTPDTDVLNTAAHGWGYFYYNATYTSSTTTTCIEDPNSGIGNNCVKFTDKDNKKHGGGDSNPTSGATLACADNNPGTTLTYQFYCTDGVDTSGFITLVPYPNGATILQTVPDFTGPCSTERVMYGKCTMLMGGVPTKTRKIKGQNVTVVDQDACLEIFPEADVPNALGSDQTQLLAAGAILYYEETAYQGSCDQNNLPTLEGAPTAAFGKECTSDMEIFTDNTGDNYFPTDPEYVDGFDNELRVCYKESNKDTAHTNNHDVETVELANITVDFQPTLNLNCWTGNGSNDSGIYKVWIPDQGQLLASSVVADPLDKAPKLEGLSPSKVGIVTLVDTNGTEDPADDVYTENLELTYPTCAPAPLQGLAEIVFEKYGTQENNSSVTLNLTGDILTKDELGNPISLGQTINVDIVVKVNGL